MRILALQEMHVEDQLLNDLSLWRPTLFLFGALGYRAQSANKAKSIPVNR